jgi:hypothetical protein
MPKLPTDYSKTAIYKLVHIEDYDNANIYIGSTTDFIRRKNNHKSTCNLITSRGYNDKKYQYIRNNGGWGCFNMIEVEKYPCADKREAEAREEYWRCYFNSQLNTKKAYTTDAEAKERQLKYSKAYYRNNIEKCKEYQKQNYQKYKDKKIEYNKRYYRNKKNSINIEIFVKEDHDI